MFLQVLGGLRNLTIKLIKVSVTSQKVCSRIGMKLSFESTWLSFLPDAIERK